ncbi:MAG: PDZ domain-containing protein [Bacteroidota bacterium]
MTRKLTALLILVLSCTASAQELKRRAHIGVSFSSPNGNEAGAVVRHVESGSSLAKAGLAVKDKVIRLNQELVNEPNRWSDILYDLRAGDVVNLEVLRESDLIMISATLAPLPKESYSNTEVTYAEVMSAFGDRIRTITTLPKNSQSKLPALFVVGGLSCSSIEVYPGRSESGWTKVLRDISTKSGMVVMRVEKPGVGDSNGHCGESDFHRDISAFEAAYQSLKKSKHVDSTNIIIYGSSMGSALAPHLANKLGAAGIISDGTFVKTWFEHMLEIERRIRLFEGDSPVEVARKMNEGYIPLYYGMLIQKKSYEEVIKEQPELAQYNYHSPKHMYGRPVSYYHQVQDFNFAKGWEELKVPVRIIRGVNDWIMSADDNDMIIDILESNGHKDHELYLYQGLDHWNIIHEKAIDSYKGKEGRWEDKISQIIIEYAKELSNK